MNTRYLENSIRTSQVDEMGLSEITIQGHNYL